MSQLQVQPEPLASHEPPGQFAEQFRLTASRVVPAAAALALLTLSPSASAESVNTLPRKNRRIS